MVSELIINTRNASKVTIQTKPIKDSFSPVLADSNWLPESILICSLMEYIASAFNKVVETMRLNRNDIHVLYKELSDEGLAIISK